MDLVTNGVVITDAIKFLQQNRINTSVAKKKQGKVLKKNKGFSTPIM